MKRIQYVIIIAVVLALSIVGLSLYGYQLKTKQSTIRKNAEEQAVLQEKHLKAYQQSSFDTLPVQARALYVKNLSTGKVVYEKNSNFALPLASLAKIMTTVTALSYLDTTTPIIFSESAVAQTGDQGFSVGESVTLEKLIPFMLVTSSNDAGYAIAETTERATGTSFLEAMNNLAVRLGFESFNFQSATGLDIGSETSSIHASAEGNARDVAELLVSATQEYPEYFNASSAADWNIASHAGTNTNILTESVPGFLVSKTGFTNKARGNLAFIVEIGPNQPYVVVIMGSTFDGRFSDAKKIINTLYTVVRESDTSL